MSLASGLNRGVVTRVTAAGLYVQIPALYGESEIGPLDCLTLRLRRPARSTDSAGHAHGGDTTGDGAHAHNLPQVDTIVDRYQPGDRVLIGTIEGGDWIVLGRIQTGVA